MKKRIIGRREFLKLSASAAGAAALAGCGVSLESEEAAAEAEARIAELEGQLAEAAATGADEDTIAELETQLAEAQAATAATPEKLVYWHLYFDDDADKGRVIKDFAASFTASSGIEVELSQVLFTDHVNRMGTVGVAQDKVPDIFSSGLAAPGLQGMVGGGYVLPLDDFVTPEVLDQFLPPLLEQCRVEGKLYALPQESQVLALVTNSQVLTDLGLAMPTTLDELESAMDKMLAADIVPLPIVLATGNFAAEWLFQVLAARAATQAQMDAVTTGEAKFSDTFMVIEETMERWAQKGYYGQNTLASEWDLVEQMQYEGKVAMAPMGGFWPGEIAVLFGAYDLDFHILVPPPLVDGVPKQVAGGLWWGVSVNSHSEYPEAAFRLALTMSGKAFSEEWVRRTLNLAAGAVDREAIIFPPLQEYLGILDDHQTVWLNVPAAISTDFEDTQAALVAGTITAQEAADTIDGLFSSL